MRKEKHEFWLILSLLAFVLVLALSAKAFAQSWPDPRGDMVAVPSNFVGPGGVVSGPLLLQDGACGTTPSLAFNSEPNLGFYRGGTDHIAICLNSGETAFNFFKSSGNFILNSNGQAQFSSSGNARFRLGAGVGQLQFMSGAASFMTILDGAVDGVLKISNSGGTNKFRLSAQAGDGVACIADDAGNVGACMTENAGQAVFAGGTTGAIPVQFYGTTYTINAASGTPWLISNASVLSQSAMEVRYGRIGSATITGNVATKQTIFTVPTGKTAHVDRVMCRGASAAITVAKGKFGFNAAADNVIGECDFTSLADSTYDKWCEVRVAAQKVGAAADVFGYIATALEASADTIICDVFGSIY